jgi:Aspartyl protease
MWPNGRFVPRYDGTNSPYTLVVRAMEARNGQGLQPSPNAGVQTIQSTVTYEPYSSSEDESSDEDLDCVNYVDVNVNAARAENRQDKSVTTRAGRTTRAPRRDVTEPMVDNRRVMKARKERRAEDLPVMKARQEGTYEEVESHANTQGTLQAEVLEDQDGEMEDAQTSVKQKIPTTTLRKEIKEARKRGDISEEIVMKNVLDATIKLDLQTFLAIAPAIERRFFGRWQTKEGSSIAPSANLKKMSAGLGRYIESQRESVRFLTADTPKVAVTVRGASQKGTMQALIDSGAELSVIDKKEALELGLPISHDYKLNINGAIGDSAKVWGCCENVVMTIAGKPFITNIWVMEGLTNPLILGNPFTINSNLKVS